jgi:CheY-like chemotaxis protein
VLLVDDDEASLAAMTRLLELDGVEVTTAEDGAGALSKIGSGFSPDLILLDIGLPQMDGYEVCRRLRALAGGTELAIFALTGFGQDSDREAATRAGFTGHLTKPVDVDEVYAAYARIGGRSAVPAPTASLP